MYADLLLLVNGWCVEFSILLNVKFFSRISSFKLDLSLFSKFISSNLQEVLDAAVSNDDDDEEDTESFKAVADDIIGFEANIAWFKAAAFILKNYY